MRASRVLMPLARRSVSLTLGLPGVALLGVGLLGAGCAPTSNSVDVPATAAAPAPTASTNAEARPVAPSPIDCPRAESLQPDALRPELSCLLQQYVRIDTTNPPGRERAAAEFLRQVLARDDIHAELAESAPGRANLMARVRGSDSSAAVALVHHMDVVPAEATEWSVPPFSGVVQGDELWGRGALDNKGAGILQLLSVVVPRRRGVTLRHDTLLLALADEESGGGLGVRWLLEQRPKWLEGVQVVLNEGGAIVELAPGRFVYSVEVAQKAPLWLRVTAHGKSGHGSMPSPGAASHRLIRALARLEAYEFPLDVVPEVQALYAARARSMPPAEQAAYLDLRRSLKDAKFRQKFLADAHEAALVRNTVSITMLAASDKENVLSGSASAVLDLRLLPGQPASAVTETVRTVLGDAELSLEVLLSREATSSLPHPGMLAAIATLAAQEHPGTPVSTNFIGGFTDCNSFRARGIPCYGFLPLRITPASFSLLHGKDERVSLTDFVTGTRNLATLLALDPLKTAPP